MGQEKKGPASQGVQKDWKQKVKRKRQTLESNGSKKEAKKSKIENKSHHPFLGGRRRGAK